MDRSVAQLIEVLRTYGLADRDPRLAQYQMLAESGMLSPGIAKCVLIDLQKHLKKMESRPNLLFRPPDFTELYPDTPPDIVIGKLCEGEQPPLGLFLSGATFCLFAGRAGSGKTTGLRNLILEVHRRNQQGKGKPISVICWDRKGGDYADIPRMCGGSWLHLSVHESLRLGLNAPDGCPPQPWINTVSTCVAARAGMIASAICLANMIRFLVIALNGPAAQPRLWPSFELILEVAESIPLTVFSPKEDYKKVVINILNGIKMATGPLFQTFEGLNLEHIVSQGKSVVIDMPLMSPPWVRALATDLMICQLLLGRQYRHQRSDVVDCLLVLDEADQDISRTSEEAFPDGMSPISICLKQGRESGIAVALGISAMGPASRMVLTNTSYHFCFAMSDAESLMEAKRTLLLPPGAEAIFPALRPGEVIFRGPGPWPHAMLAQINPLPPSRVPRPEKYDTHPFIPSKQLRELPQVQEAIKNMVDEHRKTSLGRTRSKQKNLPDNAFALLNAAIAHPWLPVARLWEATGKVPSPPAQVAARKELEDGKLAEFEEVRISKRNVLLIRVTDEGYTFQHHRPLARKGRGGIAHSHIAEWLRQVGEKRGHESHTEWIVPGTNHPADAAWKINGHWHVFEVIVACETNLIGHLETCFIASQAVAAALVVAPQKSMLDDLKRLIESAPALSPFVNRTFFEPVEAFLKELSL
jgi:hypothetical protein